MMAIEHRRPFYRFHSTRRKSTMQIFTYLLSEDGKAVVEKDQNLKFVVLTKTFDNMQSSINLKQFIQSITHSSCAVLNQALFASFCVRCATCLVVGFDTNFTEVTPVCAGRLCKDLACIDYQLGTGAVARTIRQDFQRRGIGVSNELLEQFVRGYFFVASDAKRVRECAANTKVYLRDFWPAENYKIVVNYERFEPAEVLFSSEEQTLQQLVFKTIQNCDGEFRYALLGHIWIYGYIYPGMPARLAKELYMLYVARMIDAGTAKDVMETYRRLFAQACIVRAVSDDMITSARHVADMLPDRIDAM